jgi:hypothetical protein
MKNTQRPCSSLLPGHLHCVHGHAEDCPNPGDCEYPQLDARRTPHDYEPGDTTHPMSTDPECRICGLTRRDCEKRP